MLSVEFGLPNSEEWPGVPAQVLRRMVLVVMQLGPNIRGRHLMNNLPWMSA
jgi:hypothetical protein